MLKCDSCSKTFQRVGGLFEHIQSSCLNYYQSHPQAWAKILSKLGNENGEGGDQPKTNVRTTSPARNKTAPTRTVGASKSAAVLPNSDTLGSSSSSTSNKGVPFVCKCEAQFKKLEPFKAHLKVCTPGKEPPFCIMFKAQEGDGGKSVKNVHMTVNDYFYGTLPGKRVKMKKINRRCNCYSCGKNLRNNVRYMSHVRHKIIHEWESKEAVDARNICQHCYRQYDSPFLLQCHLENVHGAVPAACTCRICELHFPSERSFLFHMKDKHLHNEAPYVCKVCNYRSSFYNDVIKHFRDEHGDTSALMCPFCLAVSFNSSSFLRHVLQHIKKGAECHRCRLIFTGVKEKAAHLQIDHISQLMTEKLRKYKNLQKCQIYVRVASFQMTQRQHLMQKSPEKFSKENGSVVSLKRGLDDIEFADDKESSPSKKVLLAPCVELPAYLCPLKKPQKLRKVRVPRSRSFMQATFRCVECGDAIQKDSSAIVQHFQNLHECRWCVFITSCEKAACNHVLKEHADAELREQLVGKSESDDTSFDAILVDDDDVSFSNVKEEPKAPPSPMNVFVPNQLSGDSSETDKSNDASKSPQISGTSSKARRKQSNPMKISDPYLENSPSAKKVRREKKVQVRVFEAEKGTQACDLDFKPDDSDVELVTATSTTSKKKSSNKAAPSPIKKSNHSSSTTKTPTGTRHRKILAPEGYFPDIDDDEGWAKYFAEVEGATTPASDKPASDSPKPTLGMVPKTTATSIIPQKTVTSTSGNKTLGGVGSLVVTSRGVTPSITKTVTSDVSKVKSATTADKPSAPWVSKSSLPTMVSTAGPVFRFQVVPGGNAVVPSAGGFSPRAGVLRPLTQTSLVTKVQKMLSQVPQSPVDLRCLEFTHSSMLIQWDAPPNCIVTQYKVIFQGSGAPTVQLLPPEQTLVRLVGLKSDTMYVVRVYSLCSKAVSQYAFLYQRTNKMPRDNPRPGEDVVLVVDDDPPGQSTTVKTTAAPPTSLSMNVKPGSLVPKADGVRVSQTLGGKAITSGLALGSPVTVTVPSAAKTNGSHPVLANSNKEHSNKKLLIDELVSNLKKNKAEKLNGTKSNVQSSLTQQQNPTASDSGGAKTPVSTTPEVTKPSGDEDSTVVDGDAIYMVLDSPGRGDVNVRMDSVKPKTKEQTTKPGSKLRTILPKPSNDHMAWVPNVAVVPTSLQLHTVPISEVTDPSIQITAIKSSNTLLDDGGDKPDIIIEQNDSNEATETKTADVEVNIVNVVSLSKKQEQYKNTAIPSNPVVMDTSTPQLNFVENIVNPEKQKDETPLSEEEKPESTETSKTDNKERASQQTQPEEATEKSEGLSDDTKLDFHEHNASLEVVQKHSTGAITVGEERKASLEVVQKRSADIPVGADKVQHQTLDEGDGTVTTSPNEDDLQQQTLDRELSPAVATRTQDELLQQLLDQGCNVDPAAVEREDLHQYPLDEEHSQVVTSPKKDEVQEKPVESVKLKKKEKIDNVVIVLRDILQNEQEPSEKKVDASQTEKDVICEISLNEPIQSSEISQSQDSIAPLLSLMPQPLKPSVLGNSEVSTSATKGTLDEKTGVFQEETKSEAGNDSVTVFIDNVDETSDASGTDIDDALDNEIKILSHNSETVECGSGPTLDDIKDIMDSDLSWL